MAEEMPQSSNSFTAGSSIWPTYDETTPAPNNPTVLEDLQNLLDAAKDTTDVYIYPKIIGRSSTPSDNNQKFLNTFDLALEWEFLESAKNQKKGKNVVAIFTSLDTEGWKYWAVFIVQTPEICQQIPEEGTTLLLMDPLLPPKINILFQDLNSRQQSFTWSLKNSSSRFGLVNMEAGPWQPVRFSDFGESYTYSELAMLWLKERLVEVGFAVRDRGWGWNSFLGVLDYPEDPFRGEMVADEEVSSGEEEQSVALTGSDVLEESKGK